jgi:alkylation response protein AidB-like acyl-CoA dehydrogenase
MAGLLVGAMKRAFELTLDYANQRVQFGKSIGKFQAIQHQLAVMAEQVAAAAMAAQAAFAAGGAGLPPAPACAVAKARTSEAAAQVAAIAHAVHGAIGITEEYDLQLVTRRLHEWRVAHGSEAHWHGVLGRQLLASPLPTATDFVRTLL